MKEQDLLWVEVDDKYVTFRDGATMPEPSTGIYFMLGHDHSQGRKEFARWSGVTFPKGRGTYGVRVKLAIIRRYRSVKSEEFVAAKHTTQKLVEVK